jgi:hypothetical protein
MSFALVKASNSYALYNERFGSGSGIRIQIWGSMVPKERTFFFVELKVLFGGLEAYLGAWKSFLLVWKNV